MNSNTQSYTRHNLSACFADMPESDKEALEKSILQNGLLNPIVLFEGKVLDGWHRFNACKAVNVKPRFVEFEKKYKGQDPVSFVIAQNELRKNTNKEQRVFAIVQASTFVSKGANQHSTSGEAYTEKQLALLTRSSVATVQKAKQINAKADIAVKEAVKNGTCGFKKALLIIKLPHDAQATALERSIQELEGKKTDGVKQDMKELAQLFSALSKDDRADFLKQLKTKVDAQKTEVKEKTGGIDE